MATDNFKPKGQAKASKQDAGGGVIRSLPVLGVVKNNIDSTRGGRIQVYIADFGAPNPDNITSWTTVSYMSPFFGSTLPTASKDDYGTYTTNPTSYGMWFSPPDVGSTVVCLFINGDPNYGYYIGGVLDPELLQMIPAIGSSNNVVFNAGEAESYGGAINIPVTNLNTNNSSLANGALFLDAAKPAHSYSASIFSQQGLIRDNIRGPITSSALRESPSRVGWGVSTPGRPIFQGGFTDANIDVKSRDSSVTNDLLQVISRRGGHSIVMDDGTSTGQDNLVRIRTSLGHQITMSDNGQTLFIIHSNGQSYIELGKEGTIDMYSTNSVNIRTQGDLNLHADNNININAKKDLNIAAENLKIDIQKDITFRAGANFSGYTLGKYSIKVNGTMSMGSDGEGSYASGAIMYINGSKINLNTGSTSATPKEVPALPVVAHTDTLFDKAKGWAAAPASLLSIVSRAPAHSPWANASQGVDVKINSNASANQPSAPSPAVAAANASTAAAPNNPPSAATVSSVPATQGVSNSLDKNTTAAMVSSVAASTAAVSPAVLTSGAAVITNASNQVTAAVGSLGQTPQMLENAGVLKAGSASLVNSLISSGANVASAMPTSLFTGMSGAISLPAYANNIPAQVTTQVTNFQQAQTALTQTGLITGKEAPSQIAGMVTSVSQVGLGPTTDFVKNASSGLASALPTNQVAALTGAAGSAVSQAMSAGNFSANLGTNLSGGLSSLATSLGGIGKAAISGLSGAIDAAKGIAASAFGAITSSFKSFKPNVPQNLSAIAAANAASQDASQIAAKAPTIASGALGGLTGAASGALGGLTGAASGALGGLTGAASGLASGALGGVNISSQLTSGIGSGLSALPGGARAVSSLVNNSVGSSLTSNLPGVAGISSIMKDNSSAIQNNISGATSLLSTNVSVGGLSSSVGAAVGGLAGGLSSAVGGLAGGLAGGALSKLTGGAGGLAGGALAGLAGGALAGLATKMASGNQSLTSLASSGLPAGAAAQLQASINSLSSSSPFPIKMPTIAANTNDRSDLTAQLSSNLGNSKIPAPDFSAAGPSAEAKSAIDKDKEWQTSYDKLTKDWEAESKKLQDKVDLAILDYKAAKHTLPQGDPEIDRLRKVGLAAVDFKVAEYEKYAVKRDALIKAKYG